MSIGKTRQREKSEPSTGLVKMLRGGTINLTNRQAAMLFALMEMHTDDYKRRVQRRLHVHGAEMISMRIMTDEFERLLNR
jgi:hypothetical protein